MASDILIHTKHVHSGLFEYCLHFLVAADLALILGILQVVGLDMLP